MKQNALLLSLAFLTAIPVFAFAGLEAGKGKKDKEDFPPFEKVTRDTKEIEGFFPLYHDEKKDKLYMRIPRKMLGKDFLIATSIARGPFFAGWQWADGAVYWDRVGKRMVLMESNPRYTEGKGSSVEDVIRRTYTDTIVKDIAIVTEANGGDPLIDLSHLLKADILQIGQLYDGRVDGQLSRFGAIKNFEKNTEIGVDLAVMNSRGDGGPVVRVHYSMSYLPENGYKPREADSRVGYFLTAQKDFSVPHESDTLFKRLIHRWQLRKSDPKEAVSDVVPEDQIIFYIEKTVPVEYRRWVREGILEWNKAFEAAGLRNAIVVRQQTDTNEYKDIDPEDVRYNFFRWIVSGWPFAMGPSRVNPFTGQILDADIIFDDSYVRYNLLEYGVRGPKPEASFTDKPLEEFFAHHSRWDRLSQQDSLLSTEPSDQSDQITQASKISHAHELRNQGLCGTHKKDQAPGHCEFAQGMVRQLSIAAMQFAQEGKEVPDEFIGQAIKETVMHEAGHTLGLRHNFRASSWLPLDKIKSRRFDDGEPTTASVMDYNPYTYARRPDDQGAFATPTLGPYDYLAIEYGYRYFAPGVPINGTSESVDSEEEEGDSKPSEKPASAGEESERTNNRSVDATVGDSNVSTRKHDGRNGDGNDDGSENSDKGRDGDAKPNGKPKAPGNEEQMLAAIAARQAEEGLAYATDEDTSFLFPDPRVNRWDNGDCPLKFAKEQMEEVKRLWSDGLEWSLKEGDGYYALRRTFNMLLGDYNYAALVASRMVGGQYINRDHKGDPGNRSPIEVVDVETQRKALDFLANNALSDKAFNFSPELLRSLAPGRWWHWESDEFTLYPGYPIHDVILSIQSQVLFMLMNPFTVNRVYDSAMLVPGDEDAMTVPELLRTTSKIVWAELENVGSHKAAKHSNRQPLISSYRRALQRQHVQMLIDITLSRPGQWYYTDAHSVARFSLKELSRQIDDVLANQAKRFDDFTRAHLTDSSTRIHKALEAEFTAN